MCYGCLEVANFLIKKGANQSILNKKGKTAWDIITKT